MNTGYFRLWEIPVLYFTVLKTKGACLLFVAQKVVIFNLLNVLYTFFERLSNFAMVIVDQYGLLHKEMLQM